MQISELIMANNIELDVLEQLTLNLSDFSNCLPVPLMLERQEVETRPFRKQGIRSPKRGVMYSQQCFQLYPALLKLRQPISEFIPATVITQKIVPALFAFKHHNRRDPRAAIDTNSSDIDPIR
jgi:hypothetical protein